MTTPPPAAVRAAERVRQKSLEVFNPKTIEKEYAEIITTEYAPMVEALVEARRVIALHTILHVGVGAEPMHPASLKQIDDALQLLKETK